jgi:hypothetical protein
MILSAKTTDVERVTMEKCVKRILKQAEQIAKWNREQKGRKEWKRSGKERCDRKEEKLKEQLDKERNEEMGEETKRRD